MTYVRWLVAAFAAWIEAVASAIVTVLARCSAAREVQLVEQESGVFAVQGSENSNGPSLQGIQIEDGRITGAPDSLRSILQGSRVEIVLRSTRFLSRPLELPKQALEFLDGIVRSQIDRLTPWSASDAAYGWTTPSEIDNNRILVTVAATARALVTPFVDAVAALGAKSIAIATVLPSAGQNGAAVTILQQSARGLNEFERIRRLLLIVLTGAMLTAAAATVSAEIMSAWLESTQDQLARQITARRAALHGANAVTGSAAAELALERRKNAAPARVMVLEALSKILPDHTYVIELRIEGDRMQVIGVTKDAPALIQLIEQSEYFTRATFFAPTTRSTGDLGERFHIEARIKPQVQRT